MQEEVFITGANGEVGHGLINFLGRDKGIRITALDLEELDPQLQKLCSKVYQGDILDSALMKQVCDKHRFSRIFHLAGVLSTGSEKNPLRAHCVNVEGSLNVINLALQHSELLGKAVVFVFPSTVAIYGVPSLEHKSKANPAREEDFLHPLTIYGNNKLYVENLGVYFSENYRLLDQEDSRKLDFRAIRFAGIVSTDTLPTSGTSDYFPEMVHAAAKKQAYHCFVRPDTAMPFMVMPDAVRALIELSTAAAESLSRRTYNISSFSITAEEIKREVLKYFPEAEIAFKPDANRQRIVDSWPADIDDLRARKDWGWKPQWDKESAFENYIIPGVRKRYENAPA